MSDDIPGRVSRIYAAIGASEEANADNLKAQVAETPAGNFVMQDFSGGMSEAELSNQAYQMIHNVANLRDHLKGWARRNGKRKDDVEDAFNNSLPLRIIQDLSNNDKHGATRDGGFSGLAPTLTNICRPMQLTSGGGKAAVIKVSLGSGKTVLEGDAKAVVTGDVIDSNGKRVGGLREIIQQAVSDWEKLLAHFGL